MAVDDEGRVAFGSYLGEGGSTREAVLRIGPDGLAEIAIEGAAAPGGGRYAGFGPWPTVAPGGVTAFIAALDGGPGPVAAFESAGRAAVHRLERYLNTLGTIASAAPLLGLMGTVIGMIEIFGSQAPSGGNNPALLAHGISVALYNTAFGLMIAIPTLMFYRYFRGLVESYTLEMEQASDRLVPHLMRFAVPRSS